MNKQSSKKHAKVRYFFNICKFETKIYDFLRKYTENLHIHSFLCTFAV